MNSEKVKTLGGTPEEIKTRFYPALANSSKMLLSVIFVLTATLACLSPVCADDFFAPPSETEDFQETIASPETIVSPKPVSAPVKNVSPETGASANIYLDSSQVDHPVLRGIFPSPSEYKAKNSLPADVFTPNPNQKIITTTYKVDNEENPTEIQAVETKEEYTFNDMSFFAPPSEYKKSNKKVKTAKKAPQELPSIDEEQNYYASAEQNSTPEFKEMEGKPITDITFNGLKLVNENTVLNVINTRNGAVFNPARLQEDLQKIYNIGYFTDSMSVEPNLNKDGTVSLVFTLKENPEVKNIEIYGNSVYTENELLLYTKKIKNMPQNLNLINEAIEGINKLYEDNGYILAKVTNVDDDNNGTLTFEITEGVIDKIVFEGAKRTKDYVIQRNIMTQAGTVYNEEALKKDLAKIYATQIFEEVNRKIEPSPDYNGEYIITIVVKEASSNSISIGGGVDNALGAFGSLSLIERNFLGKGQQIKLSGMLGSGLLMSDNSIKNRMNYQVELSFFEPHFINSDNSLMSRMYFREFGSYHIPLAIERRIGFNTTINHKIKGHDNLTANLALGYENIHLKEGDAAKMAGIYAARGIPFAYRSRQLTGGNFINVAPGIQYSTLDNESMPRQGMIAKASFIESFCVDKVKNTNGRLAGSFKKYFPIFEKSTISIGAKAGIKVHGDHMPEVMAFRLGGPYSIRGFRMNGVGSGDSFLMGSVELQTPLPFMDRIKYDVFKNLRFAFFVDAGKIWDPTITSKLYDRPNSAITAGVGLRIQIPGLGPISVDYGLPLTNVGHYNKQWGYFTFGTEGIYDNYY